MPFTYYGGKKALARYYPPPSERTIIEPFAGSAGYALHWATPEHHVILIEKDRALIDVWRRLQKPETRDYLIEMRAPKQGERTDDLLLAFEMSLGNVFSSRVATDWAVTSRIELNWPRARRRLLAALPLIRSWEIIEGDYTEAPDVRATWFVDPPYWVPPGQQGTRGDGYRHGASGIDFAHLAEWSRARRGQVIVCEQEGATWLPFRPLRRMTTAAGDGGRRTEVVWSRTPGKVLGTPAGRAKTEAARQRRAARIARNR